MNLSVVEVSNKLKECAQKFREVFHMAPAIVPDVLDSYIFLAEDRIYPKLKESVELSKDQNSMLSNLHNEINRLQTTIDEIKMQHSERRPVETLPARIKKDNYTKQQRKVNKRKIESFSY